MALHGIAHVVGFVGSWQLGESSNIPYKTTLLNGKLDVGDVGIRVVGVFWLVTALAFAVASLGAIAERGSWVPTALVIAIFSMALSLLEWPAARIGVFVNIALVAALLLGRRQGWI